MKKLSSSDRCFDSLLFFGSAEHSAARLALLGREIIIGKKLKYPGALS
jgi:hypothetical protein